MKDAETILPDVEGHCRTDLAATIRCLMGLFGGPEGLARQIKIDFDKNDPGSANRIKLELALLNLLQQFSSEGEDDDEEMLEAVARQIAKEDGQTS